MPHQFTTFKTYVGLALNAVAQEYTQQTTTDTLNAIGSQAILSHSGSYIPLLSTNKDLPCDTTTIIQNGIVEKTSNNLFKLLKGGLYRIDVTFTSFISATNTENALTTKIVAGETVINTDQLDSPSTLAEYITEIQTASDADVRSPHAVDTRTFTHHYYYNPADNNNSYIKCTVEGPDDVDSFVGAGYTIVFTYLSKTYDGEVIIA